MSAFGTGNTPEIQVEWDRRIAIAALREWKVGDRVKIHGRISNMSAAQKVQMRKGRMGTIRRIERGGSSGTLLAIRFVDSPRGRLSIFDAAWFVQLLKEMP